MKLSIFLNLFDKSILNNLASKSASYIYDLAISLSFISLDSAKAVSKASMLNKYYLRNWSSLIFAFYFIDLLSIYQPFSSSLNSYSKSSRIFQIFYTTFNMSTPLVDKDWSSSSHCSNSFCNFYIGIFLFIYKC